MGTRDLQTWLTLKHVPGIGNLLIKRLLTRFNTPANVLQAARKSPKALYPVSGVTSRLIDALAHAKTPHWAETELEKTRDHGYRIVTLNDKAYPSLLAQIPDPPPYIYLAGKMPDLKFAIALVGSRKPTPYGLQSCRKLSVHLAGKGATIVSGMALGIDTAAHEGALSVAGGRTIAVLGSGLAQIYPRQNRGLFRRIIANNAVISEFPLFARPEAHHFPQRNRLISGLSNGTVVVEAATRSGSLITARLAAEQNREVFAVPGSIDSFESAGTHQLIQRGAKLITGPDDILDEFPGALTLATEPSTAVNSPQLTKEQEQIYALLTPYPVHIDEIVKQSQQSAGTVSGILLQLELIGVVLQSSGKRFSLRRL